MIKMLKEIKFFLTEKKYIFASPFSTAKRFLCLRLWFGSWLISWSSYEWFLLQKWKNKKNKNKLELHFYQQVRCSIEYFTMIYLLVDTRFGPCGWANFNLLTRAAFFTIQIEIFISSRKWHIYSHLKIIKLFQAINLNGSIHNWKCRAKCSESEIHCTSKMHVAMSLV